MSQLIIELSKLPLNFEGNVEKYSLKIHGNPLIEEFHFDEIDYISQVKHPRNVTGVRKY